MLKILAVLAAAGAYLGGVPAWHWYRRYRRRQQVASPADEVETAWAEVAESLELGFGLNRRPSETRREYARRLTADMRVPRQPMTELADKATVARYHPGGLGAGDGHQAMDLAAQIESSVRTRVPVFNRWKRMIDPRRVLKPSARITMTSSSAKPKPPESTNNSNGSRPRQLV